MKLSIVIVNFNGARFLRDTLDTALASELDGAFEIIVWDNGSTDTSKTVLSSYADRLCVVYSDENVGFSEGNNRAVALATGEFVFFLNNDTQTDALACQRLIDVFSDAKVGAAGPQLRNVNGSVQLPGGVFGHYQYKGMRPRTVTFLSGAALMMRRDVYHQLGGFDPVFFFYNEDLDLCRRIRNAGYRLRFVPTATVVHLGGQSTAFLSTRALFEGYRGGMYFAYKHYGLLAYFLYRILLVPVVLSLVAFYFLSNNRDQGRAFLRIFRLVLKGYQDVF